MNKTTCILTALLGLSALLYLTSECKAAVSSANYTLVNFVINTNMAAETSSANNETHVAAGQNFVVLSESPLYKSLPGYISQITATAGTFSAATLDDVYVYPNPFKPNSPGSIYEAPYLTFRNLPEKATIKIFTITMDLVATIEKDSSLNGYHWPAKNNSGKALSSGLYIYYITEPNGRTSKGKFTVIR